MELSRVVLHFVKIGVVGTKWYASFAFVVLVQNPRDIEINNLGKLALSVIAECVLTMVFLLGLRERLLMMVGDASYTVSMCMSSCMSTKPRATSRRVSKSCFNVASFSLLSVVSREHWRIFSVA